jgi:hypothetical protein
MPNFKKNYPLLSWDSTYRGFERVPSAPITPKGTFTAPEGGFMAPKI